MRTLWTVLSFAAFLGIVFWAYSGKRKARFDEAARLALDDTLTIRRPCPSKNHRYGRTT